MVNIHEKYIKRCIQIGKNGLGTTRPNPMVGCVIVHNNKIIGEGFTSPYGSHHAEVNAIHSVRNKTLLKDATLYVTLEPCSHFGKTPPCSDLIIHHQINQVVIGTIDVHSKVAGEGVKKLKESGCQVTVGVLEKECRTHHQRFFTYHTKKRPYIILKWAESKDGFIAPETKSSKRPVWISSPYARLLVHKWRSEEHAILVGSQTVRDDDPSLTVRDWTGLHPVRVVLDQSYSMPDTLNVFNDDATTIRISSNEHPPSINWENDHVIAQQICDLLYQHHINSVIIEGGAQTLQTFIYEDLWDEARVFIGQTTFSKGVKAPLLHHPLHSQITLGEDLLNLYRHD